MQLPIERAIATPHAPPRAGVVVAARMTPMQRTYREMVDGWLYWSVLTLAQRRTDDILLQVRTAQKACSELWSD